MCRAINGSSDSARSIRSAKKLSFWVQSAGGGLGSRTNDRRSAMRVCVRVFLVLACLVAVQSTAWAQATIAGSVKDSSGAVLPGVTVEAASPALIEKVRTTTTDGAGRYRIEDLRPGTYSVTFTLPGF